MENQERQLNTTPGVRLAKLGFRSSDGETQIKALLWTPEGTHTPPKAIIQLVHGMAEHIGRYNDFANFLAGQGYAVCAHDMIGHGFSIQDPKKQSCIPLANGKELLIEDIHELRKTVASRYSQQTPYVLFGHSMGSYLLRSYIARHGSGLAGVVLCGTGQLPVAFSWLAHTLAVVMARFKGEDYRSPLLQNMGVGAYAKRIENARTGCDWLSTDEAVVDAYIADPLCGLPFSVGANAALTDITGEVAHASCAAKVPKELPLFFIAGACDPVGDFGKGVRDAASLMQRAGLRQVDVRIYEGMRHEILNETDKQTVYDDVAQWIASVLETAPTKQKG
ncbi:MAG: lysophospholipase [Coriobacteriaceae bacterium]|jgi:alpha-beta hydrolase superfamily lysophospholipase|nr:lysophospholipase [Coriobacteriaceae bacterium]